MLDVLFGIWLIYFGSFLTFSNLIDLNSKDNKDNFSNWTSTLKLVFIGLMCIILSFGFLFGDASLVELVEMFLD